MCNFEYEFFDGEYFNTLNIVKFSDRDMQITIAITCAGKITVKTFDLYEDDNGLYFEYGPLYTAIYIEDFEHLD